MKILAEFIMGGTSGTTAVRTQRITKLIEKIKQMSVPELDIKIITSVKTDVLKEIDVNLIAEQESQIAIMKTTASISKRRKRENDESMQSSKILIALPNANNYTTYFGLVNSGSYGSLIKKDIMERRNFSIQSQKKTIKWEKASGTLLTQGKVDLNNAASRNAHESITSPASFMYSPNAPMTNIISFWEETFYELWCLPVEMGQHFSYHSTKWSLDKRRDNKSSKFLEQARK
jgi:hypothetical protein